MPRIAMGIHYDGTMFHGWQIQPCCVTVQEVLEKALANFCQRNVRIVAAGRTDTGVHALGQVIHFDTTLQRSNFSWLRGINAFLPKTVSVQWVEVVPDDFHARFHAIERTYDYILICTAVRPSLFHQKVGWLCAPLDIDAMIEASRFLIGYQDFSAFRSSACQSKSPYKIMYHVHLARDREVIRFRFVANSFLHHMIRNIIGCLLVIGRRQQSSVWLKRVIESRDRKIAAPTFLPDGLYLSAVKYNEKFSFLNHVIAKNTSYSESYLPFRVSLDAHVINKVNI